MDAERASPIVHYLDSLVPGGTERTLVALLTAMDSSRAPHAVVTARRAGPLAAELPDHVPCQALERLGRSRTAGVALGRLLRARRVAVLHARNVGCWADAVLAGILAPASRIILGFHGQESGTPLGRRARFVAQCALRGGAHFTSVSYAGRELLATRLGVPWERIEVLPNGVDTNRFRPAGVEERRRARSLWGFSGEDFVVGIVASLAPVKRHEVLLEAVQRRSDITGLRVLVIGDGPQRSGLAEAVARQGMAHRVTFAGARGDVRPLLAAMDACVCCSDAEGLSNALLEAMAVGLPVVSTDVGDHALLLHGGKCGLLFRPGDTVALSRAIGLLANDTDLRRRLARAARARAEQHPFASVVRAYDRYYAARAGSSGHGSVLQSAGRRAAEVVVAPPSETGSLLAIPRMLRSGTVT